jgi:hypothetical protein
MVTMLDVEYDGRTVIIDGERFPCIKEILWDRGGIWRIPMESGLFVEFVQGEKSKDPANDLEPGVALMWAKDPLTDDLEEVSGVIIDKGAYIRQSKFSGAAAQELVTSGAEIRAQIKKWYIPMEIIDSARLRQQLSDVDLDTDA